MYMKTPFFETRLPFRRFRVKEPCRSEPILAEMCYLDRRTRPLLSSPLLSCYSLDRCDRSSFQAGHILSVFSNNIYSSSSQVIYTDTWGCHLLPSLYTETELRYMHHSSALGRVAETVGRTNVRLAQSKQTIPLRCMSRQ